MNKRHRETEKWIFGKLRRRCALKGRFKHNPGDEAGEEGGKPDFVGVHDGRKLGVEITCIHIPGKVNGMPLQQHEAEEDEIVEKACAKALQCGLPPLQVGVIFTGNPPKKKDRKTDWADTLFKIVRDNCPEPGGVVYLGGIDGDDLPEGFHWIGINRILKWKKHSWKCEDEAGDVETDFSSQLQERINAKAAKLLQYRKHCDKCWLVIAAPGRRPSSFYEFTDEMAACSYASPFERVFFIDDAVGTVNELRVTEVV